MSSYNKVILMGHLTRDPEVRYTPAGAAVAQIGLAVNRKYTTDAGEAREEVMFVDITAWGKQAETIAQYLRKGAPFFLEGRLKLDQWDDKTTGKKMSKLGVVLERFQFLGAGGQKQEGPDEFTERQLPAGGRKPNPGNQPARPSGRTYGPADPGREDGPPPEDDDVPF